MSNIASKRFPEHGVPAHWFKFVPATRSKLDFVQPKMAHLLQNWNNPCPHNRSNAASNTTLENQHMLVKQMTDYLYPHDSLYSAWLTGEFMISELARRDGGMTRRDPWPTSTPQTPRRQTTRRNQGLFTPGSTPGPASSPSNAPANVVGKNASSPVAGSSTPSMLIRQRAHRPTPEATPAPTSSPVNSRPATPPPAPDHSPAPHTPQQTSSSHLPDPEHSLNVLRQETVENFRVVKERFMQAGWSKQRADEMIEKSLQKLRDGVMGVDTAEG